MCQICKATSGLVHDCFYTDITLCHKCLDDVLWKADNTKGYTEYMNDCLRLANERMEKS
jgi:hypothetical protein